MARATDYLRNQKWVQRHYELFTQLDLNNDGFISREDWLLGVDRIVEAVTDRPALIANLREAMMGFTTVLGITEEVKADKQKFVELIASLAADEAAKKERGEGS